MPSLLDYLQWLEDEDVQLETAEDFAIWYDKFKNQPVDEEIKEPHIQGSLIEKVIYNHLKSCEESNKLPTYKEAKTIYLLDEISSKYN